MTSLMLQTATVVVCCAVAAAAAMIEWLHAMHHGDGFIEGARRLTKYLRDNCFQLQLSLHSDNRIVKGFSTMFLHCCHTPEWPTLGVLLTPVRAPHPHRLLANTPFGMNPHCH